MDNCDAPDWKKLELLIAAIQKDLAPDAKVWHNAKIVGIDTETERQIDVLVEQQVGQYPIRIIIDCKDYASPVDVRGVEEFHGMVTDVRAHRGAMVCPAGFTSTAKKLAKKRQIELYRPADTDPHKWQMKFSAPVVCDFRTAGISFNVSGTDPAPMRLPERFYELPFYDEASTCMGSIYDFAVSQWNDGQYPTDPGLHEMVALAGHMATKIDNGHGTLIDVTLTVSLCVTAQRFFGHLPVPKLRGLVDDQTGLVVTNAFTVGGLDPSTVMSSWQRLQDGEPPPKDPVLIAHGLVAWSPMRAR